IGDRVKSAFSELLTHRLPIECALLLEVRNHLRDPVPPDGQTGLRTDAASREQRARAHSERFQECVVNGRKLGRPGGLPTSSVCPLRNRRDHSFELLPFECQLGPFPFELRRELCSVLFQLKPFALDAFAIDLALTPEPE